MFNWFDARDAQEFGVSLAEFFIERIPLDASSKKNKSLAKKQEVLDTYPVTSHTTASDALWAGVPLITRIGETFASRVAASILQTMGFPELITTSNEDYFSLALALAQDTSRLAGIRQTLAARRLTSPLFDTERFTRDLERLYQAIWGQEVAGERKPVVLAARK